MNLLLDVSAGIVAGALLGPHRGVGLIGSEEEIELIGEIGLVLLLFIIGLEINLPKLLQAGRTITVSGLLPVPICALLAWLCLGPVAGWTGGPFDRLYLALATSMSSTPIVVKLLSDKFELGTFAGRVTLSVLVFQGLFAIGFLALQPNLEHLQAGILLRSIAGGTGLLAVAAAMARFVPPTFFRASARSPELILISTMAWVLPGGRRGRPGGTLPRDGRPDRRRRHRLVPLRGRGRLWHLGRARFLHHALLRRPRPRDSLALAFPRRMGPGGRRGVEHHYGDISNPDGLRHAGIERASVVVSGISDWFLRGTSNAEIPRRVRELAPSAHAGVTADTLQAAERLDAEGADYVLVPFALAAEQLHLVLADPSPNALARACRVQTFELFRR